MSRAYQAFNIHGESESDEKFLSEIRLFKDLFLPKKCKILLLDHK